MQMTDSRLEVVKETTEILVAEIERVIESGVGYAAGEAEVIRFVLKHGGGFLRTTDDEGGGVEISLNGVRVSVFQPYKDIDRVYYEY